MENSIEKLLIDIKELKIEYDEIKNKNRFNVFSALYKHSEEKLHSRFISYLLSPQSGHGMNSSFLESFVRNTLGLNEHEFDLNKCEVIPNEINKTEYKFIDILIINKGKKQAIIVENKINARDSNRKEGKGDGYDGQLERYYNTIKTGKDVNGNENPDFKCDTVFVYYLKDNSREEDIRDSLGILLKEEHRHSWKGIISYEQHIRNWLMECISICDKPIVKECIQQYLNLINVMTKNDISIEQRKKLKEQVAQHIESSKFLVDNFKHVKWHAVDEFWTELSEQLKREKYNSVSFFTEKNEKKEDTIVKVTHFNKPVNHGILFDLKNGEKAYISGENILSWGKIDEEWFEFNHEKISGISLSTFTDVNSFNLIDENKMKEMVKLIVDEIIEEEKNNFPNKKNRT